MKFQKALTFSCSGLCGASSVVTGSPEGQKRVLWSTAQAVRPQGQLGSPRGGTIVSREASLFLFK